MPPVFQNITPAPSSSIAPSTPVQFDVVDGSFSLVLVVPVIILDPNVAGELVHDWTLGQFSAIYLLHSTRVAITNGYRYTIRRGYGWQSPPILRAWAVNSNGGIGVL